MARKVLGDDPFAAKPAAKPSKPASKAPPKAASKSPPKPSKPPKGSKSPPPLAETLVAPPVSDAPAAPADYDHAAVQNAVTQAPEVRGDAPKSDGEALERDFGAPKSDHGPPAQDFDASKPDHGAPATDLGASQPDAGASEQDFSASAADASGPRDAVRPPAPERDSLDALVATAQRDPAVRARLLEAAAQFAQSMGVDAAAQPALNITASPVPPPESEESGDETALLRSDFYLRQWGRIAMRDRSEAVDDFGLDPAYEARWRPVWDFLYDRWLRVEVEGIHHVPSDGAVALVANHGGAIPLDGVMLATALRREHPAQRQLRWLAEDFVFHMPFAGAFVNRIGAVRACQENAERLIRKGNAVALFPEGLKGIGKLYKDRYRLQRFGRGGHIKLAIRTRTPIVPVTIVGNEDTHPMLADASWLSKLLGIPYVPVTPTFPLLGPLGLFPLPAKWRIVFGEPIAVDHLPAGAADDELVVGRLNEKLRATIQDTLDRALRERRSVFKG